MCSRPPDYTHVEKRNARKAAVCSNQRGARIQGTGGNPAVAAEELDQLICAGLKRLRGLQAFELRADGAGDDREFVRLHRIAGTAFRERADGGGVAEHVGERNVRRDDLHVAAGRRSGHSSAPRVQVAQDGAHGFGRNGYLKLHYRLEELGLGGFGRLAEAHDRRAAERDFVGGFGVGDLHGHGGRLDVRHREAGYDAGEDAV